MSALAASVTPRTLARLLPPELDGSYGSHLAWYGAVPPVERGDAGVLQQIEESGLTGRGGAAFPTATKLASVARKRRTTVVANGAEGEPQSFKDAALLEHNPHLVLDGLAVAGRLVGARESTIAIHRGQPSVARALEGAIAQRRAVDRPRLAAVANRFVAGEESALVRAVGGSDSKPTGRRPFEAGVLVQNVETLAHLALVARYGAAWFRGAGTDTEPGTALATVTGTVATPGVVEFELGSTLGELLDRCGGLTEPVDAFLIGGYFGTWVNADAGLVLANDTLRPRGASLGARVIVALPRSVCGLAEIARVARYMAGESAGQCGPCVFGLPALAAALESVAAARDADAALERIPRLETQIARRGACAHPDGTLGFIRSGLAVFAAEVELHRRGMCSAERAR